jgi:hypothetical protein
VAATAAAAAPQRQQQQQQQHWQQQRLLRLQQQRVWPERSQLEKSIMACPTLTALAGVVSVGTVLCAIAGGWQGMQRSGWHVV